MKIDDLSIISPETCKYSKDDLWANITVYKNIFHIGWNYEMATAMKKPERFKFAIAGSRLYIIPCTEGGFIVRRAERRKTYSPIDLGYLPEGVTLQSGYYPCSLDNDCGFYYLDLSNRTERKDIC